MNIATEKEFRRHIRQNFPEVKITVRTVSFADLARCSSKCLTIVHGLNSAQEQQEINELAKSAGILPDSSIRFFNRG